ncbi:MAG: succinyl-diaminopimelate desuccinylase [Epsilonproteobacteria bacterium]|nr:succinyl-diaminopimelate desuccinylase [Campylobacterota bacterium]
MQADVVDLFLEILSKQSITPDDGGLIDFFENYLDGFEAIRVDKNGVKNLFLTKEFGKGEHLCFAGHIDVVPPGDGWKTPPFTPTIKEDKIFARGAQDMKSGVAAFMQAIKDSSSFNGRLSVLLTSDEEGDAKYGTKIVLEELKKKNLLPDFAIVAEPTCEKEFGDAIKIGRRGSINGVLKLYGKQGHAAYPTKAINPIDLIAPILPKIAGVNLDNGDEFFEPSRFVITDIRAGLEVTNVTPGVLKMMFNVRNSTKTTPKDIEEFIKRHFDGLDYELELKVSAKPFMTNPDSKIVKLMQDSIQKICSISPKLSTAGGTSDARFFGEYGVDTVEFGVINDTIHAPNERTSIKEVKSLYEIFKNVIKEF